MFKIFIEIGTFGENNPGHSHLAWPAPPGSGLVWKLMLALRRWDEIEKKMAASCSYYACTGNNHIFYFVTVHSKTTQHSFSTHTHVPAHFFINCSLQHLFPFFFSQSPVVAVMLLCALCFTSPWRLENVNTCSCVSQCVRGEVSWKKRMLAAGCRDAFWSALPQNCTMDFSFFLSFFMFFTCTVFLYFCHPNMMIQNPPARHSLFTKKKLKQTKTNI